MGRMPLVIRQARRASNQAVLFVLCVALSLATLTAFSGLAMSVGRSLLNDARKLHAADIIITSDAPVSQVLDRTVSQMVADRLVERANVHLFFSVVRRLDEGASLLAGIKAVSPGYPFYGEVTLASGRDFDAALTPGSCIVGQSLLDRTGMKTGDRLKIGLISLVVADVVVSESDRPLNFFSFGPRVFMHHDDLDATGLISKGGRVKRNVLLKVAESGRLDGLVTHLRGSALKDQERVETYKTAGTRIKRFLDNFFFFLKLVGLFILLMAGLGIQGTLQALLREKQRTLAIMKALGATNGYILRHVLSLVGVLGGTGIIAGISIGVGLQKVLGWMLSPFLPVDLNLSVAWSGIGEGVLLGIVIVLVFSFLPLYRVTSMRPMAIFRQRQAAAAKAPYYLAGVMVLVFFFMLVLRHMQDVSFGLYFVGGITGLVLVTALLSHLILQGIGRLPISRLVLRQAIKGLFRKGNATCATIITLTVSLAVIFANFLIEKNLDAVFVQSYPEGSPNAYFVDIQPDQKQAFVNAVGREVDLYPIVRARVTAINAVPVSRTAERKKRRDNFSRLFNLTYRHHLLEDEQLVQGDTLFRPDWPGLQVSILDTVVEMQSMKVGDSIDFKIQGVPLKARISSIRTRSRSSFSPFFYFVFPEKVLADAPRTYFAALTVPSEEMGVLQGRVVSRLPNVSVIDVSQTIAVFARLLNQLSRIIRGFTLFSIGAGLLILISAVYATRAERMVEAVYYKVLGAGKIFVFKVFAFENLMIGLVSSLLALVMAHIGAAWVCTVKLDIDYLPFILPSVAMVAGALALVVVVGMTASRSILEKRPVTYLREQADG